jgi:hypothetical protein
MFLTKYVLTVFKKEITLAWKIMSLLVTSNKWMEYRSSLESLNVRDLNRLRYIS